jgi:preprotein translocase subunit Sss1
VNYPLILAVVCFGVLCASVRMGLHAHRRKPNFTEEEYADFALITAATLTMLGLIIGFVFSMAVSRYDQRKGYEQAEANAIGTEYLRAGLLSGGGDARLRALLKNYLDQRILFYKTRSARRLEEIDAATARLQADLWSSVESVTKAQPGAVTGLVASGMNEVLDSEGRTQGAWWNRIPIGAWILMGAVAVCGNVLVGFGARRTDVGNARFFVLPLILAIAFFLIADLDSPRGGIVRLKPQNLLKLSMMIQGKADVPVK